MNPADVNPTLEKFRELYVVLREEMRAKWNRDLPLEELLFDRWERAKSLGFETGSSIYHSSYVYGDVRVGENTWIGPLTVLDGTGGLTIGRYCSVSAGVQIYTHDTWRWAVSGGQRDHDREPVTIGDCCYVGSQTVITKGVQIGDRSVIGACSLVNRNIPSNVVAAGVPCRVIGRVIVEDSNVRLQYE
jgi:acetyltransferase-like isoleucine patch superfamily enzyme